MLSSRHELWSMAHVSDDVSGINDIIEIIKKSNSRSYILMLLFCLIATIFVAGCVCRPAMAKASQYRYLKTK
jgi:hypothetical protein